MATSTSLLPLLLLMAFSSWQTFLSVSAKTEFSPICFKGMHNETEFNCAKSYSDIYNALASDAPPFDNSFNIESALFPATKRPALHVKIWVYTMNGTMTKVELAKYTWAMSCLYVVLPVTVVQLLSFGFILLNQRQTKLDVIIPPFCCNISLETRKKHVWSALAALQDLAIMNHVRDPRLNTAECVILGHDKYDITAIPAPRRYYLVTMFVCSFIVSICGGAAFSDILRAVIIEKFFKISDNSRKRLWTFVYLVGFFAVVEFILFVSVLVYIGFSLPASSIMIAGFFAGLTCSLLLLLILIILGCCNKCTRKLKNSKKYGERFCRHLHIAIFPAGVFSLHHICWIVLGIMLEPAWGMFLLFLLSFMTGALGCFIHSFIDENGKLNCKKHWWIFLTFCTLITVCSFCLALLFGGSSTFENSDVSDWGKSALIYFTGGIIAYFYLKIKVEHISSPQQSITATPSSESKGPAGTEDSPLVMRQ